jgi:hypothetical protein
MWWGIKNWNFMKFFVISSHVSGRSGHIGPYLGRRVGGAEILPNFDLKNMI